MTIQNDNEPGQRVSKSKVAPVLTLSEREELLLMKYYEGEASWRESKRARSLLSGSLCAREFIGELCSQSRAVHEWSETIKVECDLWDRIAARIEAEERSAVLLGKRAINSGSSSRRFWMPSVRRLDLSAAIQTVGPWFGRLGWGISGALVTASVGLAYLGPSVRGAAMYAELPRGQNTVAQVSLERASLEGTSESSSAPAAQVVSFAGQEGGGAPLRVRSPFEVEWMHTDGQLRMIQDNAHRSTIIWVKKREPARGLHSRRNVAEVLSVKRFLVRRSSLFLCNKDGGGNVSVSRVVCGLVSFCMLGARVPCVAQELTPSEITLHTFQSQVPEVTRTVDIVVTAIKASESSDRARGEDGARGIDARLAHLSEKLQPLPYRFFDLAAEEHWILPLKKKHESVIGGDQQITIRPLYFEETGVCLWLKWIDQTTGMKVLDSRMHISFDEPVLVGTDETAETGKILSIGVKEAQ